MLLRGIHNLSPGKYPSDVATSSTVIVLPTTTLARSPKTTAQTTKNHLAFYYQGMAAILRPSSWTTMTIPKMKPSLYPRRDLNGLRDPKRSLARREFASIIFLLVHLEKIPFVDAALVASQDRLQPSLLPLASAKRLSRRPLRNRSQQPTYRRRPKSLEQRRPQVSMIPLMITLPPGAQPNPIQPPTTVGRVHPGFSEQLRE